MLAEKVRMLFDATYPEVSDFTTQAVWAAGEILRYGNFNTYVTTKDLTKQEGLVFRHLLRLILLTEEFEQVTPPGVEEAVWKADLKVIADRLTEICRAVDPTSTEETIKKAHAADVVEGEEHAKAAATAARPPPPPAEPDEEDAFGARNRRLNGTMKNTAVLLITCPDRRGIVAAVAEFLYKHDANILHADQHQDAERGLFLMRVEWDLAGFASSKPNSAAVRADRRPFRDAAGGWKTAGNRRGSPCSCRSTTTVSWTFSTGTRPVNCAATSPDHRQPPGRGEVGEVLRCAVPPDSRAGRHKGSGRAAATRPARGREDRSRRSRPIHAGPVEAFIAKFPQRVINVHHSFLPAFVGAKPLPPGLSSAE